MTEQLITYELDDNVALIGLNRPEKRNAMSRRLFEQLVEAVCRAGEEADVGILYGHGGHFSAGLDLLQTAMELDKLDEVERRRRPDPTRVPFSEIARGPIPFVAALSGAVVGAGLELAASAHIRVADETAFFALPEAQRGIFVGGGGSVRIQRLIGYARMADMMLTGRVIPASEAQLANLAQYVITSGNVMTKARELAKKIASNAPLSNWAVTNALPRLGDASDEEGLFYETLAAHFIVTKETESRLRDFLTKKAPSLKR